MLPSRKLTIIDEETDWSYSDVVNHIDDAIITTDPEFIITSWNEGAARIHGIAAEKAIGKPSVSVFNYLYIDGTREEALDSLLKEGKWRGIVAFNKSADETLYLESQVTRLINTENELAGFVAVNRDITPVYNTRTTLKNYISLFEGLHETYLILNSELNIVFSHFRKPVIDLYGYSFNIGDNFLKNLPHHRKPVVAENCRIAFSGKNTFYKIASSKMPSVFLKASYLPLVSEVGYVDHICVVIKDISHEIHSNVAELEKYRTEDKLFETRSLLEELMESAGFPAWISDRKGVLKYTNPAYVKYFGVGDNDNRIGALLRKEFGSEIEDDNFSFHQLRGQLNITNNFPYPSNSTQAAKNVFFPVYFSYKNLVACWEFDITEQVRTYEGLIHVENEKSRLVVRSIIETQEAEKQKLKKLLTECTDQVEKRVEDVTPLKKTPVENYDSEALMNVFMELKRIMDTLDDTVVTGNGITQALLKITSGKHSRLELEIDELNPGDLSQPLLLGIYRIVQGVDLLLKDIGTANPTLLKVTKVGEFIWIIIKCHSQLSLVEFLDHPDWKDIDIHVAFLEGNTEFNLDEIRINLPVK
jgi:PAS domain S-box-containing protein